MLNLLWVVSYSFFVQCHRIR